VSSAVLWFPAQGKPNTESTIIYWQQFLGGSEDCAGNFSLPQLVGEQTQRWKWGYLNWLDAVGRETIGGSSLEQALMIRPDLSYWWMTLPTAPCFTESAVAYRAVRLWALAALVDELGVDHVEVVGADSDIVEILSEWARQTGRSLSTGDERSGVVSDKRSRPRRQRRDGALHSLARAGAFLARQYLGYRGSGAPRHLAPSPEVGGLTFIDYFDNFHVDATIPGGYVSNYWGPLPAALSRSAPPMRWMHVDCRSSAVPSIPVARELLRDLNANPVGLHHSLLQDLMSTRLLMSAAATFVRIAAISLRSRPPRAKWLHGESTMNMWPLVRDSWRSATLGVDAAQNALWLSLFEKQASLTSGSGFCVYLMENQPWELALISSWRRAGRGKVFGVAHSVVREWDLRYALGSSPGRVAGFASLPQPDLILANGPMAIESLLANGLPTEALYGVEALRFMHTPESAGVADTASQVRMSPLRVLALGEYDSDMALAQVRMVNAIVIGSSHDVAVTFRSHPSAQPLVELLDPRVKVSTATSIDRDLRRCDVVLCGSVSSALVDAMLAGIPALVLQDARVLDGRLLPVGGGVIVVHDGEDVTGRLEELTSGKLSTRQARDIFFLDPDLARWHAFLEANRFKES
jgi:surface carbohydrate biosynthesis protein (TIGR04326 family)